MKLNQIKPNPNNPRTIKDAAFEKLCKSIQEFPKMLSLRPMVVDQDNVVLGGNMRLKALQHLGFKEIPDEWVRKASELTDDEKRRFIISDNVSGGEWDWEELQESWNIDELSEWGLEMSWAVGHDVNSMADEDVDLTEDFDPIGEAAGLQRVVFIFDGADEAESYLNNLGVEFKKMNMAWQVNLHTRSI